METEVNKIFESISYQLSRSSLNYCASFQIYRCGKPRGDSLADLVQTALGDQAVVGGATVSTSREVVDELRKALTYRGDHGSHPSLDYLDSHESTKDFDLAVESLNQILDRATNVVSFWLKEGHPFYPVFWDFTFLIETEEESILFIASSSD